MEHLLTREITSSIGRKTALGRSVLWPIIYANPHFRLSRNDPIAMRLASQGTMVMSPEGLSTTQCRDAEELTEKDPERGPFSWRLRAGGGRA